MIPDTTERWVRSTMKRGTPMAWHLVDGIEEYNDDILVLRCSKRMRVANVEQAPQPTNRNLLCMMCERYKNASIVLHRPNNADGYSQTHKNYRGSQARAAALRSHR
jgi:hypothetical protein